MLTSKVEMRKAFALNTKLRDSLKTSLSHQDKCYFNTVLKYKSNAKIHHDQNIQLSSKGKIGNSVSLSYSGSLEKSKVLYLEWWIFYGSHLLYFRSSLLK